MEDVSAFQQDHLVWKVVAKDASAETSTFDGRILFHDWTGLPSSVSSGGTAENTPAQSYFDHPVPFELILPNRPFTLVVRKHRGSIAPSLETRNKAGHVGAIAWGHGSTVIYVHLGSGLAVTSLPDTAREARDWNGE